MKPARVIIPLLILSGSAQLALAVGPDYQVAPGALVTGSTVSSVVDFLNAPNANTDFGTGTVISKYRSGGDYYCNVLTADHVACDGPGGYNAYVGFLLNGGILSGNVFQSSLLAAGGPNPGVNFEDMAIVKIKLGGNDVGTLYNSIAPMDISNPAVNQLASGLNGINSTFSQYGYGYAGVPGTYGTAANPAVTKPGYQPKDVPYNLRFQDNTLTSVDTAYTAQGYTVPAASSNTFATYNEPTLHYKAVAPPNAQFQGAHMSGDSGAPMVYLNSQQTSATNSANTVFTGNVFTDWQYGVIVASTKTGTNAPGLPGNTLNGDDEWGVFIDAGNYNWIISYVPEPSCGILFLLGGWTWVAVFRGRSRFASPPTMSRGPRHSSRRESLVKEMPRAES
jgi:hypothetical protein